MEECLNQFDILIRQKTGLSLINVIEINIETGYIKLILTGSPESLLFKDYKRIGTHSAEINCNNDIDIQATQIVYKWNTEIIP